MESKFINDPVYGLIKFDPLSCSIIDTLHFQRLREIKQMGATCYVFPGSTHTRFLHGIGTSNLAFQMVENLRTNQPELDINERDISMVKLAGLCHDLGHGPFSHLFDGVFMPAARPDFYWKHEMASQFLLDHMVDSYGIDLDSCDISYIKSLIEGTPTSNEQKEKGYLYEIVANKRNGLDVDKFDYIRRDCYFSGIRQSFDSDRLLNFCRVINGEICHQSKEVYNLYELFHTRFSLFKRVYLHRVSHAADLMISDALIAADPVMNISTAVENPDEYLLLTDGILDEIFRSKNNEKLSASKAIIKRLRERKLYEFVDEVLLDASLDHFCNSREKKEHIIQDLLECAYSISNGTSKSPFALKREDFLVEIVKFNYGMGKENPVDHIKFFSKTDLNVSFNISKQQVSYVVPERYEEIWLRCFVRDGDKLVQMRQVFADYCRKFVHNRGKNSSNDAVIKQISPRKRDYFSSV